MKKITISLLTVLMIFSLSFTVYSHRGKTDTAGGHYNRDTGEYHYHHGYPEHYHTNGECPYDFVNNEKENNSSGSYGSSNTDTYYYSPTQSTTESYTAPPKDENKPINKWSIFLIIVSAIIIIFLIYRIYKQSVTLDTLDTKIKNLISKHKESEQAYLNNINNLETKIESLSSENLTLNDKIYNLEYMNELTLFPTAAETFAEFVTIKYRNTEQGLSWGHNQQRIKKISDISTIRQDAESLVSIYKLSDYKLRYILSIYPDITKDIDKKYGKYITADKKIKTLSLNKRTSFVQDKYAAAEKGLVSQLEKINLLRIASLYEDKGYTVRYIEVDNEIYFNKIFVNKKGKILIVEYIYTLRNEEISEAYVLSLHNTVLSYNIDFSPDNQVIGILISNSNLSDTAKKYAKYLGISFAKDDAAVDFAHNTNIPPD